MLVEQLQQDSAQDVVQQSILDLLANLDNYEKTPELYMDLDDYIFANRIPKLLFD